MEALALIDEVTAALRRRKDIVASRNEPFDPVALLQPGENALSRMFRELLDERGSHGAGPAFRDLFLRRFLTGRSDPAIWHVRRCPAKYGRATDGGGSTS